MLVSVSLQISEESAKFISKFYWIFTKTLRDSNGIKNVTKVTQ